MPNGILYIIGTPIGNLEDISLRALRILKTVDLVACEDTRVTGKLLARYNIAKPLISCHARSGRRRIFEVLGRLREGKAAAFVSDAGTPGISDPGAELVRETLKQFGDAVKIVPIPGPAALALALSISGFNADTFLFLGFPPAKKGRNRFFKKLGSHVYNVVLYESPHRILRTLEDIARSIEPSRLLVVTRELTKQFESIYRGTATDIAAALQKESVRGEFVIVIRKKAQS